MAYWSTILPAVTVMGFGLALIVAPLTAAVMGAVPSHNAGIASAINNVASRVAGLLAIAALGAVVAVSFDAALTTRARDLAPTSAVAAQVAARRDPTGARTPTDLPPETAAAIDGSVTEAFHRAMIACALVAALGALAAATTIGPGARRAATTVAGGVEGAAALGRVGGK